MTSGRLGSDDADAALEQGRPAGLADLALPGDLAVSHEETGGTELFLFDLLQFGAFAVHPETQRPAERNL